MLRGPWPRVTTDGVSALAVEETAGRSETPRDELPPLYERLVAEAVAAQVAAGMGIITDGGVRWADPARALLWAITNGDTGPDGMLVRAWRAAQALTDRPVAATITGPLTLAHREVGAPADAAMQPERAIALADALGDEAAALAAAGCRVLVVDEPHATRINTNAKARDAFVRSHQRLLRDVPEMHAMLAIAGGTAHHAGAETIYAAPYKSHLFDLIGGPDNWYLIRQAPAERGIICAALVAVAGTPVRDQAPMLVWAAQYAASSAARGLDRIGLANATSFAGFAPAEVSAALGALAQATTFAQMPLAEAVKAGLDPKALEVIPGSLAGGQPSA